MEVYRGNNGRTESILIMRTNNRKMENYSTQGTTKTFKEEVIETNYPTQGSTITFKEEIVYDPKKEI